MRKFWIRYVMVLVGVFLMTATIAWIIAPKFISFPSQFFSPVPGFLTRSLNNQVTTIDIWDPIKRGVLESQIAEPDVSATSVLAYDITLDQILFQKNPTQQLPMASLTKIMTAIIALEHPKPDDTYIVTNAANVGEDSVGLQVGETFSLEELLYGLILHSGNDAAEVIANNFLGGRDAFIAAMNKKVLTLNLHNTHFTNPTGLEGDGKQYTTTFDLLVITQFALAHFPLFDKIAATFDYTIPNTNTHSTYYLENETNLLTSYPGVKGVKTGFTPEAGLCLVTYLDYGGHKIIAIILQSANRRDEMKEVLDYSLKKIGIIPPKHK